MRFPVAWHYLRHLVFVVLFKFSHPSAYVIASHSSFILPFPND